MCKPRALATATTWLNIYSAGLFIVALSADAWGKLCAAKSGTQHRVVAHFGLWQVRLAVQFLPDPALPWKHVEPPIQIPWIPLKYFVGGPTSVRRFRHQMVRPGAALKALTALLQRGKDKITVQDWGALQCWLADATEDFQAEVRGMSRALQRRVVEGHEVMDGLVEDCKTALGQALSRGPSESQVQQKGGKRQPEHQHLQQVQQKCKKLFPFFVLGLAYLAEHRLHLAADLCSPDQGVRKLLTVMLQSMNTSKNSSDGVSPDNGLKVHQSMDTATATTATAITATALARAAAAAAVAVAVAAAVAFWGV